MQAGKLNTLTISRISDFGLYLADEEQNEVLLPNRYVSLSDAVGDRKEVFVYHDSEDRLVATTETPLIMAGEVACLRVVDKTIHGAFLDWGLKGKDLFLPNRNQMGGVVAGGLCTVYAYVDDKTGRCVATMKFKAMVNNDIISVKAKQEVEIVIVAETPAGYKVVINNRNWGMLYKNQLFTPVAVGQRMKAYIRKITDDNRIDVSLQQEGLAQVLDSVEVLRGLLHENGGFLPVNDDSSPEQVRQTVRMSKKVFKRTLGMLLKSGEAEITDDGIKLTKNAHR
ncbi:MAG: hypothetical protein J1E04_02435 [Alistipes sp.]|nr:hypothetical protein [Alistipes sp.]